MNDPTATFPIAKDSYLAFDGLTIKEKIRQRLTQTSVFTDQNFEGSNLAAFNDAMAMLFSLLFYNLNKTSSNGTFSDTVIYENMNRIVKEFDYKPIGHQTATLNFTMSGENLLAGFYTVPRYSLINIGGINYSLSKDISFAKTVDTTKEEIKNISSDSILFQGSFVEYPTFSPAGSPNELIYLTTQDTVIVDNFNIHVYVKEDGVWSQWNKTQSLYLNNSNENVYEIRYNENKKYELKFGDNINGRQLDPSFEIGIYYLASNGTNGEVGINVLNNKKITSFNTNRLNEILSSIAENSNYLSNNDLNGISFINKFPSSYYNEPESIASIRKNAPANFRSQFSLTTAKSYITFIKTNFANIVHDVNVKNNKDYIDSYIKYFYDIGLTKPELESRALFNQITFADSCNFNNIYAFVVPKTIRNSLSYLTPAQKNIIIDSMQEEKVLTSEIILSDPVYIAFDIGLENLKSFGLQNIKDTELYITKSSNNRRNELSIKTDISNAINDYFSPQTNYLGQIINSQQLLTNILAIDGVSKVFTHYKPTDVFVEGLNLVYWNPVYFDKTVSFSNNVVRLQDFQFPFLYNNNFVDRITVI